MTLDVLLARNFFPLVTINTKQHISIILDCRHWSSRNNRRNHRKIFCGKIFTIIADAVVGDPGFKLGVAVLSHSHSCLVPQKPVAKIKTPQLSLSFAKKAKGSTFLILIFYQTGLFLAASVISCILGGIVAACVGITLTTWRSVGECAHGEGYL